MAKERIKLEMSIMDAVAAIAEGNPGAVRVCCELLKQGEKIDPDAAFKGLSLLLGLDTLGIYAHRIWMLYKDVCKQNLEKMIAVLRANQLGFVSSSELNFAIDNMGEGIDVDDLMKQVKERLPNFGDKSDGNRQKPA